MQIDLPLPPSVNHIWRRGRGRTYLSANYSKWIQVAHSLVAIHRPKVPMAGPVSVRIVAWRGKGWAERKRDLDNIAKPVLDLLVREKILAGDDHTVVKRVVIELGHGMRPDAGVMVEVEDYEPV